MRILVIDPGSISTKYGIYENGEWILRKTIHHNWDRSSHYPDLVEQEDIRASVIQNDLKNTGIGIDAVAARGGLMKPVEGGAYAINDSMVTDMRKGKYGIHASNLGPIIASRVARLYDVEAFTVDAVVVDELEPLARLSGLKGVERESIFHALNQKAVGREIAARLGKQYAEVDLIIAHLGSGISVGAHRLGRVVDVNNALDGDGPYALERTGELPLRGVLRLLNEGWTSDELVEVIRSTGGVYSYLGESDLKTVVAQIDGGDEYSRHVLEGMAYQTAKAIAAMGAVLKGHVDGIVLTGGCAHCEMFVELIRARISFLGTVFVVPGERELEALAEGVKRVLTGEEQAKEYRS